MSIAALEAFQRALGPERVLTDEVSLLSYSYDGALDRARPEAVLLAASWEHVQAAVRICLEHRIPYVARGAGTNLSGGCIPLKGGVVLSTARMDRILEIDTRSGLALVEPGVVNLRLQKELEKIGWFYAPDPASYRACTLGGNVAENAGGPRCLKYGVTMNHVLGLEAVMPDGSLQRFRISDPGPDLTGLLTGAEGTLGVVTKIWLRILPQPEEILTILAAFPAMEDAIQCVSDIVAAGVVPRVLEAMDRLTIEAVEAYMRAGYPAGAEAVLLIELDGSARSVKKDAETVQLLCLKRGATSYRTATDPDERERLWEGRRGAYAAMARIAPNVLVEDGVVPRPRLPEALARIREIAKKYDVKIGLLFHAGDGNLHPNIVFDERRLPETKRVKKAGYEILKACVALEGSISGEHGIGVDKRAAMAWLFAPPTLALLRRVKRALDPELLANPDKLLPLSGGNGDAAEGPRSLLRPVRPLSASAEALARRVRETAGPVSVIGRGTRLDPALRPRLSPLLTTEGLDGIVDLDRANYTVTVEAGAEPAALRRRLEREGLHLGVPASGGTVGGLLAARPWPGLRDQVLGLRVLLASGEVLDLGGKVVKNVAGYDLVRLLLGSWGAYAVILEATFKLYASSPHVPKDLPAGRPFTPGPWHRKLKEAFDPGARLNPWVCPGAEVRA